MYLANNEIKTRRLNGTDFNAKIIDGAEPKPHELEIGKILEENGYEVLFTPENIFVDGMKNPEGIITKLDKIVEMKEIKSTAIDKVEDRIKEAVQQKPEIIILNLKGNKKYSKETAIQTARNTIQKIIPNKVRSLDKTKLKGKDLTDALDMSTGLEKLKEVWLIWNGDIIKIKK